MEHRRLGQGGRAVLLRLLALLAGGLLLLAAPAHASLAQESIFEDGHLLLESGAARQQSALDEMAALGADTVRVLVFWNELAPRPGARKPPKKIVYSGFERFDEVVAGARARGMDVLLTPVGRVPRWASGCRRPSGAERGCKVDARLYGGFVRALGRHFPDVHRWGIWNEPNQAGWLSPQFARRHGRLVNVAALKYRQLALQAIKALRATGHGSRDVVLLGETAPVGRRLGKPALRASPPVTFIRTLLCIDGGRCPRLRVTGFAHHPYTQGGGTPPGGYRAPGQISFTEASRLERLLDAGARRGTIPRRLPVYYTEFGYQTNPPDPLLGVEPAKAAEYLNYADYLAAGDSRIKSVAQYKLVDDQDQASFQTGLRRYGSLRRKLTYAAYRLPIWVTRRGDQVSVYGQLRPAVNGTTDYVDIQRSDSADGPFESVQDITVTSRYHQFRFRVPYRKGFYRLSYRTPAGRTITSRAAQP